MNESTTGIDIVPSLPGQEVLTEVLQDGARRVLAQAIEAEAATWIEAHAHLSSWRRGFGGRYLFSTYPGSKDTNRDPHRSAIEQHHKPWSCHGIQRPTVPRRCAPVGGLLSMSVGLKQRLECRVAMIVLDQMVMQMRSGKREAHALYATPY
jgi:hypothetical protein